MDIPKQYLKKVVTYMFKFLWIHESYYIVENCISYCLIKFAVKEKFINPFQFHINELLQKLFSEDL